MATKQGEGRSKHETTMGEDHFEIVVPMVPTLLPVINSSSDVVPELRMGKDGPGKEVLIMNVVKLTLSQIAYCQVVMVDQEKLTTMTCVVKHVFPGVPENVKMSLSKKYSEFIFRPNTTLMTPIKSTSPVQRIGLPT